MSKKIKMIAIPLLAVSISSIGVYSSLSNNDKVADKVEASSINSEELAKQSIQDKMLNSVDYFKNAKGSFRYYIKKSNIDDTVTFNVNLNGKPGSYVKTINNQDQSSIETTFDGDNRLNVDNENKTYTVDPVLEADSNSPTPPKSAKGRYLKGQDGFIISRDPANMGQASSVLNNQYIALGFLEDYNKWEINEDDEFLGLPATVITGELPDMYKERFDGELFKIWVHKDTGIILNLEIYDDSKEIVNNIKLNDIKLNTNKITSYSISDDAEEFKIEIPENYKEDKHEIPNK